MYVFSVWLCTHLGLCLWRSKHQSPLKLELQACGCEELSLRPLQEPNALLAAESPLQAPVFH